MKKIKNMEEEKNIFASNRIYKKLFYIIFAFFFLDIAIKFNLLGFENYSVQFLVSFGLETVFFIAIFFISAFMLAKKGITIGGAADLAGGGFSKKRYFIISIIGGAIVATGLWTIRFVVGNWEYGVLNAILFCGAIYLITLAIAFTVLFTTFYFAHKIAKRYGEKNMAIKG